MDKDLEAIGAHCQYTYCNQLDFLPFRCESCTHTFCLDHRTETAHKCIRAGHWARAGNEAAAILQTPLTSTKNPDGRQASSPATSQCAHLTCKSDINTLNSVGVACPICKRQYCLKHRLREDHRCSALVPTGGHPTQTSTQADKAKAALGRLRAWSKDKQAAVLPKPKPSSATSRIASLNSLKKTAKGDEKVPMEKRVYLHVEAEAATTSSKLPKGEYWYSNEWSIGRVLDAAAKGLQIRNLNNSGKGEAERLRIFHVEQGRLLEYAEKTGDVCVNGNTIVLLRGVGPSEP